MVEGKTKSLSESYFTCCFYSICSYITKFGGKICDS